MGNGEEKFFLQRSSPGYLNQMEKKIDVYVCREIGNLLI